MTQFAYLHGEGIVFSSLIHCFFILLSGGALLYGLVKYKSWLGAAIAAGYAAVTLMFVLFAYTSGGPLIETAAWTLTLPWNMVVPCYNLDQECELTAGVSLICAGLNAATIYVLVAGVPRCR